MSGPRSTYRYQQARAAFLRRAKALGLPCGICGQPIDYGTRWNREAPPPGYPTVDHADPLAHGGSLLREDNFVPAHFACNSARGAGRKRKRWAVSAPPSRQW